MQASTRKVGRLVAVAIASAMTVGAVATPTFAQDYRDYRGNQGGQRYGYQDNCQEIKHQRTTTGGILGALAGAAIGSNLAAHGGGRTGGAVLGAVAGAVVGSNVGRDSAKDQCGGGYYRDGRYYAYPVRQTYGYGEYRGYDNRGAQYEDHRRHDDQRGYQDQRYGGGDSYANRGQYYDGH